MLYSLNENPNNDKCCNTPIQFSFLQSWHICAAAEPIMLSLLCEDSYAIKILQKKVISVSLVWTVNMHYSMNRSRHSVLASSLLTGNLLHLKRWMIDRRIEDFLFYTWVSSSPESGSCSSLSPVTWPTWKSHENTLQPDSENFGCEYQPVGIGPPWNPMKMLIKNIELWRKNLLERITTLQLDLHNHRFSQRRGLLRSFYN